MKSSDDFPGNISIPYGIKCSHTWHEVGQILRIINDYDIQTFVELGVHEGGLASALLPINRYRDFVYVGIELDISVVNPAIKERVWQADILERLTIDTVKRIMMSRKTLIYCDGGNKVEEMKAYAPILKSGDILMCHDYYDISRNPRDLEGYGDGLEYPRPEVYRGDIEFLASSGEYLAVPSEYTWETRIAGFIKL